MISTVVTSLTIWISVGFRKTKAVSSFKFQLVGFGRLTRINVVLGFLLNFYGPKNSRFPQKFTKCRILRYLPVYRENR